MDNPFEFLPAISICTGIRGLERGIERVIGPLRTIAYAEIEAFIIQNLLEGMQAGFLAPAPFWANLKTFPWRQFRGRVGIVLGGYPCQPFSHAGLRKGADDPRHLWPYIEYGIRTIKPLMCFFENVAGHLSLGFEQVAASLQNMGYRVEAGLYTAAEVGAPHKRARLFILAILDDADGSEWRASVAEWIRCSKIGLHGERPKMSGESKCASKELADPRGDGPGTDYLRVRGQGSEDEGKAQRQKRNEIFRERSGCDARNICANVGYPACITKREQADENNAESSSGQTRNEFSRPGVGGENMGNSDGERFVAIRSGTIETKGLPTCSGIRGPNINTGSDLESGRRQFAGVGRAMAYAIGAGLEKRQTVERRCNVNRWPGRPGEPQYEWEAPRTVESGMGCTIDGYNFREDILRALGNGVVEDTAEIAFIDLLNKHFS